MYAFVTNWITPSDRGRAIAIAWLTVGMLDLAKHILVLGAEPPPPQLDALGYWQLGGRMAAGDVLLSSESGAYRTPGLPLFLAPFHLAFGVYALQAALFAQHLLIIATSLLTAGITGRVTGSSWAAVAAYILSAFCYSRDWHANLVLSETLFTLLLTAAMTAFVAYTYKLRAWPAIAAGALVGAATLVRPIATYLWVPLAVSVIAARIWTDHEVVQRWRPAIRHAVLVIVAFYFVLSPWLLRNHYLFGSPFMTRFVGRNLWVVTFEPQSGSGLKIGDGPASRELLESLAAVQQQVVMHDTWSVSNALAEAGLADDEIDALMLRVCRELIAEERPRVVYKTVRRTINFWRCVSNPFPFYERQDDQEDYGGQVVWNSAIAKRIYIAMNQYAGSRSLRFNELVLGGTVFGLLGLLLNRTTRAIAIAFGLTLLYFNVVTAVLEIPSYRYRMILEPLMVTCCMGGLMVLWSCVAMRCNSAAASHRRERA